MLAKRNLVVDGTDVARKGKGASKLTVCIRYLGVISMWELSHKTKSKKDLEKSYQK